MKKRPRFRLILAGALAASVALSCQGTSPSQTPTSDPSDREGVRYVNEGKGFAIVRPADWTEHPNEPFTVITFASPPSSSDTFAENVGVATDALRGNMTFKQYEEVGSREFREATGAEFSRSEATEVAGYPAFVDQYSFEMEAGPVEGVQWTINADGRIFLITYWANRGRVSICGFRRRKRWLGRSRSCSKGRLSRRSPR